jgi:hypothetical protein
VQSKTYVLEYVLHLGIEANPQYPIERRLTHAFPVRFPAVVSIIPR